MSSAGRDRHRTTVGDSLTPDGAEPVKSSSSSSQEAQDTPGILTSVARR